MRVVVASHGHCFDGLASATLFTHLFRELGHPTTELEYRSLGYAPGAPQRMARLLTGEQNALLDYRFHASSNLTWYFDHHSTAFASPADRAVFDDRQGEGHFFYEPECSSCSKLITQVALAQFGVNTSALSELTHWADVIDSANFSSPEAAIDTANPILRLANVVEHHGDDKFYSQFVPLLLSQPLHEVAQSERVTELHAPLTGRRELFLRLVKEHARTLGRVVFVDLTAAPLQALAKFVTYALFPESVYSVLVGRFDSAIKISVGHNPWCGTGLMHDVGAICARHGGGGHAMVGGIAFPLSQAPRALIVAQDIARELNDDPTCG